MVFLFLRMVYTIYWTGTFQKMYDSLPSEEKQWILKIEFQVKEFPYGKVIRYFWFREKKYLNKRLYFLIDEQNQRILFVDFGSKKEQKKAIQKILRDMDDLLLYLRSL